jgi:hypothetical protein
MPIKVFWGKDGPYALADSPAEAAELMRLASSNGSKPTQGARNDLSSRVEAINEEKAFRATLKELGRDTKQFLTALVNHHNGVKSSVLIEETKQRSASLGAIITNLFKAATKNGLTREDFLSSESRRNGAKRERIFTPGPLLLKYEPTLKG